MYRTVLQADFDVVFCALLSLMHSLFPLNSAVVTTAIPLQQRMQLGLKTCGYAGQIEGFYQFTKLLPRRDIRHAQLFDADFLQIQKRESFWK